MSPMLRIYTTDDLRDCQRIWRCTWPSEHIFDTWQIRDCFQRNYGYRPLFVVAEEQGSIQGLVALSWIDDEQYFGHFPGETWQRKTWLEQNKIIASSTRVYQALISNLPGPARLRYLTRKSGLKDIALAGQNDGFTIDEVGYLFYPANYGYCFNNYLIGFSGKSRKRLGRELDRLRVCGVAFRYDHLPDVDQMFEMNLNSFAEYSYFHDPRFMRSFIALVSWLKQRGLLRVTTLLLGDKVAAVDVGALWRTSYTVLAGGTHPEFPGAAKLMNFHHIERSCVERFDRVDFLCGDFGWKRRFHLAPRPLYQIQISERTHDQPGMPCTRSVDFEQQYTNPRRWNDERLYRLDS